MIKQWLAKRRAEEKQLHIGAGFAFAMVEYFRNEEPIEGLECYTDAARLTNSYSDFDRGIDEALVHLYAVDSNINREGDDSDHSC